MKTAFKKNLGSLQGSRDATRSLPDWALKKKLRGLLPAKGGKKYFSAAVQFIQTLCQVN